jgi:hypothetical protein
MDLSRTAGSYDDCYLQIEKPQPFIDKKIENLIMETAQSKLSIDISDNVYENFKQEMEDYVFSSRLNDFRYIKNLDRKDICIGCTQFIDSLYMQGTVQTLEGDYRYHLRLNPNISFSRVGDLVPDLPLIIAMPFPSTGDIHINMDDILEECLIKNIPLHIDGAWITCCRDISFDFNHPAIHSIAISLSKGLGLGWNRVGLRWSKSHNIDAISIMNDYRMNLRAVVNIGLHFIRNIDIDHLWLTHAKNYNKICRDFSLMPTKSIYIALKNGQPVGLSPLLRYLENNGIN